MEQVKRQSLQKRDQDVLARYAHHFGLIEQELEGALTSTVPAIEEMGRHTLLGQGKRLRPLLFILSAHLFGNEDENLYRLSVVFEYIHTASLLHDDVLDNAEVRRKKPSANILWGNHAAVLEGDFLYSKAFQCASSLANLEFLKKLTHTTTVMAEGQVLELLHTCDWDLSPETYFAIIVAKTAVLISAACACGGIISGARAEDVARLERFGKNMGIAFQLMDDVLDFVSTEDVFGKPVGKDMKEGKVTLPLIYTLAALPPGEKEDLVAELRQAPFDEELHARVGELVRRNGALSKVRREAERYTEKAASILAGFPPTSAKDSLLELNRYIVERSY